MNEDQAWRIAQEFWNRGFHAIVVDCRDEGHGYMLKVY